MKRQCPEDCNFRNKDAPFCGFCMVEVLNESFLYNINRKEA